MELEKVYEPQRFEPRWAQWWIDSGIFHATVRPGHKVFSLVIPPPNVTGSLHMGHMLEHTEIDVTVRWHRMCGFDSLWLPGTDHAGIATQMVVERMLREQGIERRDLGREEFEKRVWEWKEQSGGTIKRQMVRMGASCDWSRERFTLDEGLSKAVREVFVGLYVRGLIYRGEYMINWCPDCGTALSDLEVTHEDTQGKLWHIRYPVVGSDRHVIVATTRPETMLGDTAVAINAHDERYKSLHGHSVLLPLVNREIPIILDEIADPEFGTGVVKITPAHDLNDFEAGKRHNLPLIQVIDESAKMTAAAGVYAGLDRFEARETSGSWRPGSFRGNRENRRLSVESGTLQPEQNDCRTAGVEAVVREDQTPGRQGDSGCGDRPDPDCSRELDQDLQRMDVQHPRLVRLPTALVGTPDSGVVLPGLRRGYGGERTAHYMPHDAERAS